MFRIRKNDVVKILVGKDKGKTGKVLEVHPKENRVIVEGINLVSRHRRPRRRGEKGQKLIKPAAINESNVMPVCASCGKATRVRFEANQDGSKSRVCIKCEKSIA